MLRALVLVAVMHGVASADFGEQIEGELRAATTDLYLVGPPAELARWPAIADVEARSVMFEAALRRARHPFVRAQIYLARAELWAAYAYAQQLEAIETFEPDYDVVAAHAIARAIKDYRELYKLPLAGWRPLDRALASFAFVLDLSKLHGEARFVYGRVLAEFPHSPHAARAHLALGDAALAGKRMTEASAHYDAIAASPHANDEMRVYALYKAGWITLDERGEAERAFAQFAEALKLDPDGMFGWELRRGASKAFALIGAPADAYAAFAALAPDHALEMLLDLAERWAANMRHRDTLAVLSELVRRAPRDPRACEWQAGATRAAQRLGDDAVFFVHAERLVNIFTRIHADAREDCEDHVRQFTIAVARTSLIPALSRQLYDLFLRAFPDRLSEVTR